MRCKLLVFLLILLLPSGYVCGEGVHKSSRARSDQRIPRALLESLRFGGAAAFCGALPRGSRFLRLSHRLATVRRGQGRGRGGGEESMGAAEEVGADSLNKGDEVAMRAHRLTQLVVGQRAAIDCGEVGEGSSVHGGGLIAMEEGPVGVAAGEGGESLLTQCIGDVRLGARATREL